MIAKCKISHVYPVSDFFFHWNQIDFAISGKSQSLGFGGGAVEQLMLQMQLLLWFRKPSKDKLITKPSFAIDEFRYVIEFAMVCYFRLVQMKKNISQSHKKTSW